jgi:two-component system NarL family response regulator
MAPDGFPMKTNSKPALVKQIRVVIADDHPVVREGLNALVAFQKDMQVVSEAANGQQAVEKFFLHRPDVLLLDLRMPIMNGMEAIHAILEKAPEAKIIVLSTYDGDEDVYRALQAGAKAYLLKDSPRDQLLDSIRAVYSGQLSIPSAIGAKLAASMAAPKLTKQEMDITKLLVAGKSNKEIGASFGITEGTVKVHTGHIFKKLGASGRTEAIRIALERGIAHLKSENGL